MFIIHQNNDAVARPEGPTGRNIIFGNRDPRFRIFVGSKRVRDVNLSGATAQFYAAPFLSGTTAF